MKKALSVEFLYYNQQGWMPPKLFVEDGTICFNFLSFRHNSIGTSQTNEEEEIVGANLESGRTKEFFFNN